MFDRIIYKKTMLACLSFLVISLLGSGVYSLAFEKSSANTTQTTEKQAQNKSNTAGTAHVMANGDILIHDGLYGSAEQADGSYDFTPFFEYVKDWISSADLTVGDYEGTISPDYPLGGYPLFNTPSEIINAMKDTGYDIVDLAHNHILNSGLSGAISMAGTFESLDLSTIGIYKENRDAGDILIRNVNGIKIAILGYSYGYNDIEANVVDEDYKEHMSDLDKDKMKSGIQEVEEKADITIIMPRMGTECTLEPTDEQVTLYHRMVDQGTDVVFDGCPHVTEPSGTLGKDGDRRFIIYPMGNFISNQRLETIDNIWTERSLLTDVTFEKKDNKTAIKTATVHPTMVWAWSKDVTGSEGFAFSGYQALVLEDFIEGGKYRDVLDSTI